MITKNLGLLFIIICIIFSTGFQNANADIFDDMADLLKKVGTATVCLPVLVVVDNFHLAYPRDACKGL